MDEQHKDKKKSPFMNFMDKYGFAVFLCLGVALVAGIGWAASALTPGENANPSPTPIAQQSEKPQATAPAATQKTVQDDETAQVSLNAPAEGETGMIFSADKPVFNETLSQWETHNGVDICAKEGTEVRAALDGKVVSAEKDDQLGNCITIEHENGLKTVYASLSTLSVVKVDQTVKQGELIGAVGTSADAEVKEGAHLHFEVWQDDKPVDPATLLQE